MFWRTHRRHGNKKSRKSDRRPALSSRRLTPGFEALETRRVLTTVTYSAGILTVDGSGPTAVNIAVSPTKNGLNAQVTSNGVLIDNSHSLASINEIDITGSDVDDVITVTAIDKAVTIDGGGGSNRFVVVGDPTNNNFELSTSGTDTLIDVNKDSMHPDRTYTISNVAFIGIYGQSGQDKLTVDTVPALSGTNPGVLFDGGGNVDTLVSPDTINTWNILLANGGNLMPTGQGTLSFGNVENLTGGSMNDAFNYGPNGSLADNIDGGGGTNSLSFSGYTKPITFTLRSTAATGLVGYGTGLGGLLRVSSITGGSGNNTLVGPNTTNTWDIAGNNGGTLGAITFSAFENLIGGSQTDNFVFADGSAVTGTINGGAGKDTVDFSAYSTAVAVNLQTKTFAAANTAGFANIESFVGGMNPTTSSVTGPNAINTWNISTMSAVNHALIGGIDFAGFGNLTGGSKNDTFFFAAGASVAGTIDGGAGLNTLNYSKYTTAITLDLSTNTATGTGGIANIGNLIGSSGMDTLAGDNNGDTFNITAKNAGNISEPTTTASGAAITTTILTFTSIENLKGGTGADLFVLFSGKNILLSGTIDGINGTPNVMGAFDEIDYSAYKTAITVNLTTGASTNVNGGAAGGITNISDIFGGAGNDTLTGDINSNFIFGNGGNDVIDGMGGNDVLSGGNGNDMLKTSGSTSADRCLLLGGLGVDNISGSLGQNILFNGTTSFDTDTATLSAIETFWETTATFTDRVNQLRAGTAVNPDGTAVGMALNSTTVFNDTFVDTLNGNGTNNWYFAKLTAPNKDIVPIISANDATN